MTQFDAETYFSPLFWHLLDSLLLIKNGSGSVRMGMNIHSAGKNPFACFSKIVCTANASGNKHSFCYMLPLWVVGEVHNFAFWTQKNGHYMILFICPYEHLPAKSWNVTQVRDFHDYIFLQNYSSSPWNVHISFQVSYKRMCLQYLTFFIIFFSF